VNPLDKRYQAALDVLRKRFGAHVAAEFAKLPSYNESDISTLVDAVTPAAIVTADTTAKLTTGWLAMRAGTTAVATPADLPALDLPETLRPAFMTVWGALADGRSFEDAVAAGLERSGNIGRFLVTTVSRQASGYIDSQSPQITAWTREPEVNACDWCHLVAENVWPTADEASAVSHDNCHCDVVPA